MIADEDADLYPAITDEKEIRDAMKYEKKIDENGGSGETYLS